MKLNEFKAIRNNYYKKDVVVNTYDGKELIGKYDSEFRELPIIFIGDEEVAIKDIKTIDYFKDDCIYKYVTVTYDDDYTERTYSYKTTLSNIEVGDTVLVDRSGNTAYGTVESINLYTRKTAPYPIEKTKDIIRVIHSSCKLYYNYDEYDDEDIKHDYFNVLLNAMFGRVSIKRLMKLIRPLDEKILEYELYYYPKFNTFFYKTEECEYRLAEYKTELITQEMFDIMARDSIIIFMKKFTTPEEAYKASRLFCENKGISYHDDTDISEYRDIKEKLSSNKPENEEEKEFSSIEEIKEYLKNYKKAEWKTPNPSYFIKDNTVVHYMGWLDYDLRVFKIWKFLTDNKLIDEKYYYGELYPEFFDEDWTDYDIETLDYPRLCYLILKMFNIERISEGTVEHFAESGKLLKMIERLETVDKSVISNKKYKKIQPLEMPEEFREKIEGDSVN